MRARFLLPLLMGGACAMPAQAQYYPDSSYAPYCREFTNVVLIGGRHQSAYGRACYQPDGSWQVVSDAIPASQPVQYVPAYNQVVYVPRPSPVSVFSLSFNNGPRYHRPSGYYGGYRPFHYPRGWYAAHSHHHRGGYGHGRRHH